MFDKAVRLAQSFLIAAILVTIAYTLWTAYQFSVVASAQSSASGTVKLGSALGAVPDVGSYETPPFRLFSVAEGDRVEVEGVLPWRLKTFGELAGARLGLPFGQVVVRRPGSGQRETLALQEWGVGTDGILRSVGARFEALRFDVVALAGVLALAWVAAATFLSIPAARTEDAAMRQAVHSAVFLVVAAGASAGALVHSPAFWPATAVLAAACVGSVPMTFRGRLRTLLAGLAVAAALDMLLVGVVRPDPTLAAAMSDDGPPGAAAVHLYGPLGLMAWDIVPLMLACLVGLLGALAVPIDRSEAEEPDAAGEAA